MNQAEIFWPWDAKTVPLERLTKAQIKGKLLRQEVELVDTESSNIAGLGFIAQTPDGKRGTLLVFFHNRAVYAYHDETLEVFQRTAKARSVGKYFHKHIRAAHADDALRVMVYA